MSTVASVTNTVTSLPSKEPVITWGLLSAVLNAVQLLALPGLPIWVHTVIVIAATVVAVIAARQGTVAIKNAQSVGNAARDLGILDKVAKDL